MVQDSHIQARGISFRCRDWGGDGRDILLLHGLASNARFWDLMAPHLHEYHLVAVDQRSHGLSGKPEEGYDFANFAADVAAVIETLGLRRPVVVGHSWGGNVGMQVALDYPELLASLVCIDGGTIDLAAVPGATWEETAKVMAPPDFGAMRLPWEAFLERAQSRAHGPMWGDGLEGFLRDSFETLPDGTVLPHLRMDKHIRVLRAIWDQGVSALFAGVTCPVLLMPARQERDGPPPSGWEGAKEGEATRALDLLPNARLVWMEDSIHDVPVQRPAAVAQVIREAEADGFL